MTLREKGAFHVPATGFMTIDEARNRGRLAFAAGTPCAPISDSGFTVEACHAEESTSALMRAWHRGWTLANLAAPVPGLGDCERCVEECDPCEHGLCSRCCACGGEPSYIFDDR